MMSNPCMHARVSRTWCHSVAPSSFRSDVISAFLLDTILGAFFAIFIVPQHGYAGSRLPGLVTFRVGVSDQEVTESVDTLFPLYAPKDSLFFFIGEVGRPVLAALGTPQAGRPA